MILVLERFLCACITIRIVYTVNVYTFVLDNGFFLITQYVLNFVLCQAVGEWNSNPHTAELTSRIVQVTSSLTQYPQAVANQRWAAAAAAWTANQRRAAAWAAARTANQWRAAAVAAAVGPRSPAAPASSHWRTTGGHRTASPPIHRCGQLWALNFSFSLYKV